MVTATEWEYAYFTYREWTPHESWGSVYAPGGDAAPLARNFFWDNHRDNIVAEVRQWRLQGWEPLDNVDAQAIKLRPTDFITRSVDPVDVLLWLMTFGIALIVQLLTGISRHYVTYTPVEFRVRMRRPKTTTAELQAA
ncbi:MAG TPA: hypothetical protein VMT34_01530 [Aggregatilineales bacterium]|nr:hypothetical protein [Aggregatilineales bacterium]